MDLAVFPFWLLGFFSWTRAAALRREAHEIRTIVTAGEARWARPRASTRSASELGLFGFWAAGHAVLRESGRCIRWQALALIPY